MSNHTLNDVEEGKDYSFPLQEEAILQLWEETDAFHQQLKLSEGRPDFVFYDGPPFATGLPHYGHILAGTIKDVITRYASATGFHVIRRFGWDCHGLPVEFEIDKKLGITGRQDVLNMGIGKYNEECRSIVQRYTKEWREVVQRFGRWIDFDRDYKTMDISYMESCWWVFKQLFEKGQVYRAFRVMPYSTACGTPLSNFEVSQNYKEVSDPSVIVQFKILGGEENSYLLAWTTTPWTLPSNLGLCVNPELDYLKVKRKSDGAIWFVGKARWAWICQSIKCKDPKKDFDVLEELKGAKLVGITYEPLFDYFKGKALKAAWQVVSDSYVSTEAGTCIVHQAPAFGEDDNRVCIKFGIITKEGEGLVCPVDANGCFTEDVTDFKGQHVKAADKDIKAKLKEQGKLVFSGTEVHNYPHCWRSDTPLIYKACPSWFVRVEEVRDKLIANNNKTNWVPKFVQEKRFHNWLVEARDWCVSRNRYWGTPLPLWVSDDFEEVVCVGSVAELEELSGRKFTDIHRHFIDDIEIPSKKGKGKLKRVDEVFDCWFESGSMPYASKHYPFEGKEDFEKSFPAQFIAEGLDQTRGWFYTLMVLSTHLFDQPAFFNLICNGLVLAADGKKMSKRLKNYPEPTEVAEQHGADAIRMYMCTSPVVRAEPLKFSADGVRDVVKDVFLPWYNAYRFFIQEAGRYEAAGQKFAPDSKRVSASKNHMDRWINANTQTLLKFVCEEMNAYRLYTVVPKLLGFLQDLTNWYVRLNRDRMRGNSGSEEALTSLCTLYQVLLNVAVTMAPITPFITELMYQNLARALPDGHPMKAKSIHFVMIPSPDMEAYDEKIIRAVTRVQGVVELGRMCRERRKVGLKTPLKHMTIVNDDEEFIKDVKELESYVREELNVMDVNYKPDIEAELVGQLNFGILGAKLKKDMKNVLAASKTLSQETLKEFHRTGKIVICGYELTREAGEFSCTKVLKDTGDPNIEPNGDDSTFVLLDFTPDPDLERMATARNIANCVQKLRKDAKLQQDDPVDVWAEPLQEGNVKQVLVEKRDYLDQLLRKPLWASSLMQGDEVTVRREECEVEGEKFAVIITNRGPYFNSEALRKVTGGCPRAEDCCRQHVKRLGLEEVQKVCKSRDGVKIDFEGNAFTLVAGDHFVFGPNEAPWLPQSAVSKKALV